MAVAHRAYGIGGTHAAAVKNCVANLPKAITRCQVSVVEYGCPRSALVTRFEDRYLTIIHPPNVSIVTTSVTWERAT